MMIKPAGDFAQRVHHHRMTIKPPKQLLKNIHHTLPDDLNVIKPFFYKALIPIRSVLFRLTLSETV